MTACQAGLDGNRANSRNCCSGSFDTPQTCPVSKVQYYSVLYVSPVLRSLLSATDGIALHLDSKKACPDAYAYAYDESSKSALWTCEAKKKADYTITFCKL